MAEYKIESDKLFVFPSAYRNADSRGKYTSEENFVNIISSIVDKDSYVLSVNPLRFVIHGYYFKISDFSISSNTNAWAYIKVENTYGALVNFDNASVTQIELDDNEYFKGLVISEAQKSPAYEEGYTIYELELISNGEVKNKVRLSTDSVFFSNDDNLTNTLNSKQDNLVAGNGIDTSKLNTNKTIQLIDDYLKILDSMSNKTVGGYNRPIYVVNGEARAITENSGHTQVTPSGASYSSVQAALITNGELQTTGLQIFASQDSPNDSVGRNGDFWLKYTN